MLAEGLYYIYIYYTYTCIYIYIYQEYVMFAWDVQKRFNSHNARNMTESSVKFFRLLC